MPAAARNIFLAVSPQTPLEIVARELGAAVQIAGAASGVRSSVKANIATAHNAATAASSILKSYMSPYTAEAVHRLLAAKCSVSAITNMDEFGMGSATQFSDYGPCLNPWSPAFHVETAIQRVHPRSAISNLRAGRRGWLVPGGSSGGAAVSVALGTSVVALGSDTGGSVRQPAAFCGVVGFKPTYGAIPRHGLIAYANSFDTIGILANSIWNAAAAYFLAAGWSPKDDSSLRRPQQPLQSAAELSRLLCGKERGTPIRTPSQLFLSPVCEEDVLAAALHTKSTLQQHKPLVGVRIGLPIEYAVPEDGPVSRAWEHAARVLAEAGAEVVQVSLPTTSLALAAYYVLAPAEAASNLSRYDGVRYGYRASDAHALPAVPTEGGEAQQVHGTDDNAAAALHDLYKRTRSEGFGTEVQRRIMLGNFVLSQSARSAYFDTACMARDAVRADFAGVFRPRRGEPEQKPYLGLSHMTNPALYACASSELGVDVLLTPVTPGLPWSADTTSVPTAVDPLRDYLQDTLTIPASLAGLPAVSVPTDFALLDEEQIEKAVQDGCAAHGLTTAQEEKVRAAVRATKPSVPVAVQIIGRYADEATTLRVAAVLEARSLFSDTVAARRPW